MADYALGIDLGTTNSCVSIVENGKPFIIANKTGYKTTPSIVAIAESGKRLIGQLAKRQAITNAANTVFSTKRLIGRSIDDPEVQECMNTFPFEIVEGPHHDIRVKMRDKLYSLPEISAMILSELRQVAEEYIGADIRQAIITVPAYFNDAQRQATIDAGRIAGLDVMRIINEPTAAAIAYGAQSNKSQTIAVFDLGGGTFDISILSIEDGIFNVLSTTGDTFLGGEDFDNRIIEHLVLNFAREHDVDLREDPMAMQRLKMEAEKAKCALSELTTTEINLPFIQNSSDGVALHLNATLTRDEFENLVIDLIKRTLKICQIALMDANVTQDDIDEVVLVGGMTRMPLVQEAVTQFFRKQPAKNINPDEVVAMGAAIQADELLHQGQKHILLDVTPLDLGIAIHGGKFHVIINKNTTIPCSNTTVFTTSFDNQTSLRIVVLQGEHTQAADNQVLAEFTFSGIRPAPAGTVDVEITFDVDADGIVNVIARDLETRQEHVVSIERSSNLTDDEIKRMAQENADYLVSEKQGEQMRNSLAQLRLNMEKVQKLMSSRDIPDALAGYVTAQLVRASDASSEPKDLHRVEVAVKDLDKAIRLIEETAG
ncbi:MAG: molecular chaperone DnaK [Proteobacteria bacterium]|nr:molecular chaperone DnaK [Pseudomonadota bacterium]